jgi:hypothetical protein
MKIAEVVSRFSDVDGFIDLVESIGFDFMEKVREEEKRKYCIYSKLYLYLF